LYVQSEVGQSVTAVSRSENDQLMGPLLRPGTEWSVVASSSPISHANRFAVLANTDDEQSDAGQFTVHHSKRANKRLRQRSSPQQQPATQRSNNAAEQVARRQRSNKTLMGKSAATGHVLTAAKKIVKKSSFLYRQRRS